jgi:hypothetical protein
MAAETNAGSTYDGFTPPANSRFAAAHCKLDEFLRDSKNSSLPADSGKLEKSEQLSLLCAALERLEFQRLHSRTNPALPELVKKLAGRKLPYTQDILVLALNRTTNTLASPVAGLVPALLDAVEQLAKPLPKELLDPLSRLHGLLKPQEYWAGNKKNVARLEIILDGAPAGMPGDGEAWAEAIRDDIEGMPAAKRKHWLALLENAPRGTSAKPTAKWKKQADELLAAVGPENFARQIEHWFGLVGSKATDRIQARNAALLRALVWYASMLTGETVCRALANAVEGGLRKLPRGGLYASSISKACISALEAMPGLDPVAQLSRLKHRIKSPWGLEEVEQAFASAVQRSGISRAEVEEISLPTFGLDQNGTLAKTVGDYTGKLHIVGTRNVELQWFDAAGEEFAGKPKFTEAQAAEAKSLKQLAGDIEKMRGAQRDRIENFLERDRSWTFSNWQVRYLNHPLISQLVRRLIWQFKEGNLTASGICHEGKFIDASGQEIDWLGPKSEVRLWHPLGVEPGQVQAWRRRLEEHLVTQPFKQAHREIYIITDAELGTRNYSNRFAAHILRQHQFKALCDQGGWRYEVLGSWDSSESTATKDLPGWDLRAEFWIEPADTEFAASGVALHAATDQVRFSRPDGQVVDLTEVPALVFTEIMRNVDLFVSVCSVGNDPAWVDGGADRRRDYWREWSFGKLNATADTRRELLERLVPKLKIASLCSLVDRYLVVRGSLRTYKIHLGSGNILMEPNDQYLCIVPDRKSGEARQPDNVFLPFEGDNLLSVIISKAFLLANDAKIKDQSILRQISG